MNLVLSDVAGVRCPGWDDTVDIVFWYRMNLTMFRETSAGDAILICMRAHLNSIVSDIASFRGFIRYVAQKPIYTVPRQWAHNRRTSAIVGDADVIDGSCLGRFLPTNSLLRIVVRCHAEIAIDHACHSPPDGLPVSGAAEIRPAPVDATPPREPQFAPDRA